jgi:hypothetical protein
MNYSKFSFAAFIAMIFLMSSCATVMPDEVAVRRKFAGSEIMYNSQVWSDSILSPRG